MFTPLPIQATRAAGATGGGSSTVDCAYQINIGPEVNVYGYGWGISVRGNGTPEVPLLTDTIDDT
jgi:hypothetical protein